MNKRLGVVLVVLALVLGLFLYSFIQMIGVAQAELGCIPSEDCQNISSSLNISHLIIGVLFSIFSLGVYLIFFSNPEAKKISNEQKFNYLFMGLDESEKVVVVAVHDQPGITQQTLRLRTNLSKAKLSQVLTRLEKKNLISRQPKDKTYKIYFKPDFGLVNDI